MTGWKIVCPDGKGRHYPYANHADALFDAEVFDGPHENQCECGASSHTVEAIPFHAVPNPGGTTTHGAS